MPFWKCFYHVIWATKGRQAIITAERESIIHATVRRVSDDLRCEVLAVNGVADHLHVVVAIPPSVAVAQWVKQSKGASSRMVNEVDSGGDRFWWQADYGVLTLGQKALPFVVGYVERQKQHHAENHLEAYLEQIGSS